MSGLSEEVALTQAAPAATPRQRSHLKAVAVPTEHGGWGLTLEPALLGMLVQPGTAGLALAFVPIVGFLTRQPLKIALVDMYRGRNLERTRVARRVAAVELAVFVALVAVAVVTAKGSFWIPAAISAVLVSVELGFDVRSRSRRLVPELAGAMGVNGVAAMIVLANGGDARVAAASWLVLNARALTSIPFVREQVTRLHGRPTRPGLTIATDAVAIAVAGSAVAVLPGALAGAVTIAAVVAYQRISAIKPPRRAAMIGAAQIVVGLTVVLVTALGILAP
ncbi:MAG: YwiC-like family protein [Acidimicrobiia bacterium]|nr:YwiC-like family protein [Acidimicrobiia bacterium]